jgi:hypothetical protein
LFFETFDLFIGQRIRHRDSDNVANVLQQALLRGRAVALFLRQKLDRTDQLALLD